MWGFWFCCVNQDVVVSRNQLSTLFLSEGDFYFYFYFHYYFLFNSECVLLILWFEFWVERENSVVRDDRKSFEVGSQKGDYEVCSFLHSCYCLLCDYEFSRFVCCFWILEFSVWAECWGILFLYVREKEGVWFCSNWELYGILFVIVIFMELCKQFYSWSEMRTVWREQVRVVCQHSQNNFRFSKLWN